MRIGGFCIGGGAAGGVGRSVGQNKLLNGGDIL